VPRHRQAHHQQKHVLVLGTFVVSIEIILFIYLLIDLFIDLFIYFLIY